MIDRHLMRPWRLYVLTPTLFLLGCSVPGPLSPLGELDRQRDHWLSQNVDHYVMEFQAACFCPPEFTDLVIVEVLGDSILSVKLRDSGRPVEEMPPASWLTIEELFGVIEGAISQEADSLDVRYNQDLGYPERITVDYQREAVDDEAIYEVLRLEVR